jgi:hypothetical protein
MVITLNLTLLSTSCSEISFAAILHLDAGQKRRMSLSRQMSGRYQRTTNRKVEGREIQQDHSQYALTYGLMLGIRVMVVPSRDFCVTSAYA